MQVCTDRFRDTKTIDLHVGKVLKFDFRAYTASCVCSFCIYKKKKKHLYKKISLV